MGLTWLERIGEGREMYCANMDRRATGYEACIAMVVFGVN